MKFTLIAVLALITSISLIGCSSPLSQNNSLTPPAITQTSLSQAQQDTLIFLIQEEKLARDVYTKLYQTSSIKKFYNILNSEENHQALLATILQSYNITNPITDKDLGEFVDPTLTALYSQLIEQGTKNSTEAIKVGILIEEKDIKDIQDMLSLFSKNPDIEQVLQKLLQGSQNHLKAFQK